MIQYDNALTSINLSPMTTALPKPERHILPMYVLVCARQA